MRKKILRGLTFLILVAVGAALVNPFFRQHIFGPKYQGTPLCVWQEAMRRRTLGEEGKGVIAKTIQWFQPKLDKLPFNKLTRDDQIAIWMSLLHESAPAMRVQAIRTLWGGDCGGRVWDIDGSSMFVGSTIHVSPISGSRYSSLRLHSYLLSDDIETFTRTIQPPLEVTPDLVGMLDDPEEEVRSAVFEAIASHGRNAEPAFARLHELLEHADAKRRVHAAETLNTTHPKSRPWLDRLVAMLDDGDADVRLATLGTLSAWSDQRQAVRDGPRLVKALEDRDPRVRITAAGTLHALHIELDSAIATLRAGLRDRDFAVRQRALSALFEKAGKELHADILNLARSDPNENVQLSAVQSLYHGGDKAVPFLISLLRHPKAQMRVAAIAALQNIGPQARTATPYLLAMLDEHGEQVVRALASLGDADAVPRLIELLDKGDLRNQALSALSQLGPAAKPALPRLTALVRDREPQWQAALNALIQIAPEDEATLALVEELARSESMTERSEVQYAVHQLGPSLGRLVPLVSRRLDDPEENVRQQAAIWLGAMVPEAKAAAPKLLQLAQDPATKNPALYITALGTLAAGEEQVVPFLRQLLRGDQWRAEALIALGNFGHRGAAALPEVRGLLKDAEFRLQAMYTLAAIQPNVDEVLAELLPLLDDENVRHAVVRTLADFGPAARAAIPALSALLDDDSQSLCDTVLGALAQIEP